MNTWIKRQSEKITCTRRLFKARRGPEGESMREKVNGEAIEEAKDKKKSAAPSRVLTITGIVLCVILLPVLIINITLIVQGFGADKSKLPNIGGYFPLMVQSGSMSGTIEVGDLIIVHTADDAGNMKAEDIVTFWDGEPGGSLVTHRITKVTTDKNGLLAYRTQGDANPAEDTALLYPEKIVGTYVTRLPVLGNVAMFMQTIPGLIICVVLPLAVFIAYDVIRRRRIDKSSRKETAELLAELEELKKLKAEQESAKADNSGRTDSDEAEQESAKADNSGKTDSDEAVPPQ